MLRANSYTFEKVFNKKNAFEIVLEKTNLLDKSSFKLVICRESDYDKVRQFCDYEIFAKDFSKNSEIFDYIKTVSEDYDNIVHIWGDGPCLDEELSLSLLKEHNDLYCEYSFADGYLAGTSCEFISSEIIPSLLKLSLQDNSNYIYPERNFIFETIKKDINSFDIHTKISDRDMRNFRLNLFTDTKENFLLSQSVFNTEIKAAEKLNDFILKNQEILRQIPAYFQIQIVGGCLQSCSYCPYPKVNPNLLSDKRIMPLEDFSTIIDKINALNPEFVASISLWGEPSMHPNVEDIIKKVLATENGRLLIETSGLGWDLSSLEKIAEIDNGRIYWIVSLDSDDQAVYSKLRGKGFQEAMEFYNSIDKLFPENVWAQGVRMTDTEEALEQFYKNITDNGKKIIIQKYNNFSQILEDKKVVDLSPAKRYPCWHLKRELAILLDGKVVQCFNDVEGKNIWGNAINDELLTIFEKGKELYEQQIKDKNTDLCARCDEYYTYNF